MDLKVGLQLLPGTKKRLNIKVPGENRFLYIGSIVFGAFLVAYFAAGQYRNNLENQIKSLDEQILAIEQKRNNGLENNLSVLKQRVEATSGLIKDHVYASQVILKIAGLLQREVQLDSISIGDDHKIGMKIFVANYTVLTRQISSFLLGEGIEDISLGKIDTSSAGTLEVSIGLTVDYDKLAKKKSIN